MMAPDTALHGLKRQRPEWEPWLAVVEEILREAGTHTWDVAVPAPAQTAVPLLAGMTIPLAARVVRRLLERLIRTASMSGPPKMATLGAVLRKNLDVLTLF